MRWWPSRARAIVESTDVTRSVVTASAAVRPRTDRLINNTEPWQDEVWGYYDTLGELRYAIDWHSNALSRVRLRAGRVTPGRDEPELVDDGPAAKLVAELATDIGGRAQLMKQATQLLDLPGEGYLLGETRGGVDYWEIHSKDEIRSRSGYVEVIDNERSEPGRITWRTLSNEYILVRLWRPHARWGYLADAPTRAARGTMRELELVNRKIQAQYLSRLASAGVVVFPDEVQFPASDQFADAADPFVAEWIEAARTAIANPGTASAVVPIPIRVPGEYVDKIRFIDFTLDADDQIIQKRESAIRRLATQLDLPAEVMLGMGELNHWNAWQIDETSIKIHIAPTAEIIYSCLTRGYLRPRLIAMGLDPSEWVVWGDASELTLRPDRSANAVLAYDRLELSGRALRRETGFDEDDAPTSTDLREMILKVAARNPTLLFDAVNELIPGAIDVVPTTGPTVSGSDGQSNADATQPTGGDRTLPRSSEEHTVDPIEALTSRIGLTKDEVVGHTVTIDHLSGRWRVHHPGTCAGNHKCKVTWAMFFHPGWAPGTSGTYALHVSTTGSVTFGDLVYGDASTPGSVVR